MLLRVNYEGDGEPIDIAKNPTESDVAEAIRSMDWQRFAFVTLFKDANNWLDGSGCLKQRFGLSMMLSVDRVQYVTEFAPPTPESMLETFKAFLIGDDERLFGLIYDAERRGLTVDAVTSLREAEARAQRERMMREAIAGATEFFSSKDYGEFIQRLEPYEFMLPPMDTKKLAIARRKHGESSGS